MLDNTPQQPDQPRPTPHDSDASPEPAGQTYWRSLGEWSKTDEFRQAVAQEFPGYDPEQLPDQLGGISRRRFMTMAAASMALAGVGLSGCRRWPEEEVLPYASRPEEADPGVPQMYASILELAGAATPVLVQSFDGRPIKVEGNSGEGGNVDIQTYTRGKTNVFQQSTTLELYDPERARRPMRSAGHEGGEGSGIGDQGSESKEDGQDIYPAFTSATWPEFRKYAEQTFIPLRKGGANDGGDGGSDGGADGGGDGGAERLAVLAQPTSSPTIARQRREFLEQFQGATWYEYQPIDEENQRAGTQQAYGQNLRPIYDLTQADVVVSLDANLFSPARGDSLRLAYDWAERRRLADSDEGPATMNRMYVVEPTLSITGSVADERLAAAASDIPELARTLAAWLGVEQGSSGNGKPADAGNAQDWLQTLAGDLAAAGRDGKAVLIAGPSQPAEVHALCWAINDKLGAIGDKPGKSPVYLIHEPTAHDKTGPDALAHLTQRMHAGEIDTLLILDGNPSYDAPADVAFDDALAKVANPVHLSAYPNQTSRGCTWALPKAHPLEAWGDGRSYDGTICTQQPLIRPLYEDDKRTTGGRSTIELLAMLTGQKQEAGRDQVRQTFMQFTQSSGLQFEKTWRQIIHDGVMPGTAFEPVSVKNADPAKALKANQGTQSNHGQSNQNHADQAGGGKSEGEFEITFSPDPSMYDGRFANNGWLQEMPKPLTKLTWGNTARVSVQDARDLGVENGSYLRIGVGDQRIEIPVYIMPGQAAGTISLSLGYGRTASGHVGKHIGSNAYPLRNRGGLWATRGTVEHISGFTDLATTTNHQLIDPGNAVDPDEVSRTQVKRWMTQARTGKKGESSHQGNIINEATLEQYRENHDFAEEGEEIDHSLQLFPGPRPGEPAWRDPETDTQAPAAYNEPHAWGMSIDLNTCIGCNACVIACQAENNVPVVGKDMVRMSREMHWLRIDTYYKGDPRAEGDGNGPEVVHEPMMCVHCENAPCEQVCPVAATVHDTEGINTMVYNRCIGVRYCSNNCPYKVRRFNFFDYHAKDSRGMAKPWLNLPDQQTPQLVSEISRMVFNPDVTVRMRGVMEKCNYCLQRVNKAKIKAKNAWAKTKQGVAGYDRDSQLVQDGEVETACQQSCPTEAITFGNLNDPDSKVAQNHRNPRAYGVLSELNTRPRTQHMAKIRNPAGEKS